MLAAHLALALTLAAEPVLRAIAVPPALAAITSNPELSGIVYSPALQRYLLVSDDTGLKEEGTNHAPLVLALDAQGRLDERPVHIRGIEQLNDPESICAGPDGTFFLVTSHSANKKGKTKPARRQLLHLKLDGRTLVVTGSADLLDLEGGSLLEIAGLPARSKLDIEALTFHDGALYLGLKSPLSAGGAAVLLRIDDPLPALKKGRISARALHRFAELPLCVPDPAGATVCEGASDMLFLEDGSLLLTANAPKGGPKDGGGALWLARAPLGSTPPVLVRRFEGYKPEGVALAPGGKSLAVVFDRDQQQPEWIELPMPEPAAGKPAAPSAPAAR